nr:putative capsid [Marmot picobirnavirus]
MQNRNSKSTDNNSRKNGKFKSKTTRNTKKTRNTNSDSRIPMRDDSDKFPQQTNANSSYNDVSWYAKNDQILRDAASYSYNQPLGSKIRLENVVLPSGSGEGLSSSVVSNGASTSVPGVMTLLTGICPGVSQDYHSPINLAAQNIYSYVRYANSGSKNYEPVDLMLYMFAMDSIYACWNFYKRIYGLLQSYSQSNWYLPQTLIYSAGVDFNDVMANISDLRLYLNATAARITSFCVPATMPIFVRHSWMFSNVWADSANSKAQCYQFVPLYFFKYDEKSDPKGGFLNAVEWTPWEKDSDVYSNHCRPKLKSFRDMVVYLNNLIDALSKSEDIGVMSGDILKAYGQGNLFKITAVSEDYSVLPVYNEEVLTQIHNATVLFEGYNGDNWPVDATFDIKQDVDKQILTWQPTFTYEHVGLSGAVLNMPYNEVTPANTMVGSRLVTNFASFVAAPTSYTQILSCGTEFIWNAYIAFNKYSSTGTVTKWYGIRTMDSVSMYFEDAYTTPTNDLLKQYMDVLINRHALISLVSQFDWHPLMFLITREAERRASEAPAGYDRADINHVAGVLGDMSNWTILDANAVENLHLTAIMSEFNIPQIGSF